MPRQSGSGRARCAVRDPPLDKLHHESGHPPALFESVDGSDVRMIQRSEHFRFALKASESIVIRRQGGRQNLDGDLTFQLGIGGPIHLAHAPFADERGDFVDADACSRSESQGVVDYTGALPGRRVYVRRLPNGRDWKSFPKHRN